MTVSVLFVCLGNICRSPLAEAALRAECARAGQGMIVDSAGTADWHAGTAPDDRAIKTAAKHGADIAHLRARQIRASDFRDFDHIFALDTQNFQDLQAIQPSDSEGKLSLLLDFVDSDAGPDVADPYYGDDSDFEQTWAEVTDAAQKIIAKLTS